VRLNSSIDSPGRPHDAAAPTGLSPKSSTPTAVVSQAKYGAGRRRSARPFTPEEPRRQPLHLLPHCLPRNAPQLKRLLMADNRKSSRTARKVALAGLGGWVPILLRCANPLIFAAAPNEACSMTYQARSADVGVTTAVISPPISLLAVSATWI